MSAFDLGAVSTFRELRVDGDEWAAAIGRCEKRNRERGRY